MLERYRRWSRRREFPEGKIVSRLIACDIRRDILVVSAARIDEGIIRGRVRTTNLLYRSKGFVPEPEFEEARELRIDDMWHWTGKRWGGLPDGTSIVDHLHGREPRAESVVDMLLPKPPSSAKERMTPWVLAVLSFLIAVAAAWASAWWDAALFGLWTVLLAAQIWSSRPS